MSKPWSNENMTTYGVRVGDDGRWDGKYQSLGTWQAYVYPQGYDGPKEVLGEYKTQHEAHNVAANYVRQLEQASRHRWGT